MRPLTSLCFQCRHNGFQLSRSSVRGNGCVPSVRYSSLSAIHRGLRDSEKSRPQGFKPGALKTTGSGRSKDLTSRQRRDPQWTPTNFTIRKGKKDITDDGPQPKSRKLRFHDPDEKFGKKSFVYQAKHGALRQQMEELTTKIHDRNSQKLSRERDERGSISHQKKPAVQSFEDKFEGKFADRFDDASTKRARRPDVGRSTGFRDRVNSRPFRKESHSRPSRNDSHSRTSRIATRTADRTPSREFTHAPQRELRAPPQLNKPLVDDDQFSQDKPARRDDMPVRIHHTTAASQFLYGRSVVEAALKDSRRKLYRLYIYAGEDRRKLTQDVHLEKVAKEKQVMVEKVMDQDGLRMLDKMSGGRPHNGCILEASPLPQLPLRSLGPLSEDTAKSGFGVQVAHQSIEEVAINGTTDFIPYRPMRAGRKPFILLLEGILDPGNLGAILRTAAFLGVTGVAISKTNSATLTPVALKASAGASEVLPLYSVPSTLEFIQQSKEAGWTVYAAVPAGPRSKGNSHLTIDRIESYDPLATQPSILVVGSEGEGLGKPVRRAADYEVSIPGQPGLLRTVDSLNVSVATGILASAFLKKSQGFEIEDAIHVDEATTIKDDSQLW
ncbi:hypothetical protein BX600DRAFT_457768 [Xylariales sp. PMI_506]|nr:hypothetical protein BX600DRAFT_457768 [Xylariales sp. PMI_506]